MTGSADRPKRHVSQGGILQNPADHLTPRRHYDTMQGARMAIEPSTLILVDDVVTKGATLAGAAALLHEVFPGIMVRAFAIPRTSSTFNPIKAPFTRDT